MSASASTGAREQVSRLLTLVPYLHSRGEVSIGDAARVLGVPPEQVVKDLKVLFLVGLPDGYPDDLIDVDLDALEGPEGDGVIRISNADYLARPLRLTANEATAVMVALLALRSGGSEETREVVDRALAKLQAATDGAAAAVDPGPGPVAGPADVAGLRQQLERAVRDGRQVRLTYWVPARDEETERVVDPRRVVSSGGATYLDAWCHSAEDDRLFRLDRIHDAAVLDTPVARAAAEESEEGSDLFDFAPGAERVTLEVDPRARWIVEYYPVEASRDLGDGRSEVDLLVADRRWLTRLLLRLAPHARVVAPPDRHQEFMERAQQALSLYEEHGVQ